MVATTNILEKVSKGFRIFSARKLQEVRGILQSSGNILKFKGLLQTGAQIAS